MEKRNLIYLFSCITGGGGGGVLFFFFWLMWFVRLLHACRLCGDWTYEFLGPIEEFSNNLSKHDPPQPQQRKSKLWSDGLNYYYLPPSLTFYEAYDTIMQQYWFLLFLKTLFFPKSPRQEVYFVIHAFLLLFLCTQLLISLDWYRVLPSAYDIAMSKAPYLKFMLYSTLFCKNPTFVSFPRFLHEPSYGQS